MALNEKKVLMVVAPHRFQDEEYEITRKVLESRGVQVKVASISAGECRGSGGLSVRATEKLEDVKYYDFDAIVFVGGDGARPLAEHEKAQKLAKDAEYKVLGAIGTGTGILASGGVMKGKRVTGDPGTAAAVRAKEGTFTAQPIEVDNKLVTARDQRYAEYFGNGLLEALQK